MRTLAFAVAALGLLAVGGCVTSPEELRAADEAQCRSYGFRDRSEAFANCLLELDLDRRAERRDWDRFHSRPVFWPH
jgi:hypothetical protein